MTPQMWLWSAGPRCGLSDDEARARENAEEAALDSGCPALLELVTVGLGNELQPVYVHTDIAYNGTACDGRVSWLPQMPGRRDQVANGKCRGPETRGLRDPEAYERGRQVPG